MGASDYPIERFDPLLRDLVAYNLVVKSQTAKRAIWRLSDDVQRRLDQLALSSPPSFAPDQLVYLDHHCADCNLRVRTRFRDGLYLCDTCLGRREPRHLQDDLPLSKRRTTDDSGEPHQSTSLVS